MSQTTLESKVCAKCKQEFPLDEKHWRFRKTGKPYAYCKGECENAQSRKYFKKLKGKNPEQYDRKLNQGSKWKKNNRNTYGRQADLKKRFGITIKEYDLLLEKQNGVCGICQSECPTGRRLAVDHCHVTKQIRGLLCTNCNQGLGQFKDDTKLLENAVKYLGDSWEK